MTDPDFIVGARLRRRLLLLASMVPRLVAALLLAEVVAVASWVAIFLAVEWAVATEVDSGVLA